MLLSLGRGMAPAVTAASALPADGLLAESGRPLAAQSGALLILDIRIDASGMTLENGGTLIAENDNSLILE